MVEGRALRERLRAGERLIGTFVKTPAPAVVEVLGRTGIDFAVLDAEHAPFDRTHVDACVLAGYAVGLPVLVRLRAASAQAVQSVLDLGAAGVIVPRVNDVATAKAMRQACEYSDAGRGFSNSPRVGNYGTLEQSALVAQERQRPIVICQVEDAAAVERIEDLAALDDVDGFLLGRADLAVSLGCGSLQDPAVQRAVDRVVAACRSAQRAAGIFLGQAAEIPEYIDKGVHFFVVGSDQSAMLSYFRAVARSVED
ncbi:hpcH/HpaI aldolase/citrate lyase family protein [Paraburkholderia xenovorans LB400]|uniref:HpcH/HpaI aldolase n=1 Tax=Paraburkholderia xenovorans (strain LB400) TaxID=266265 RepID=Q13HN1_PARXL|nr:aldolase/citrate lyase family protein [Paraburkholderia xenovorans]ABE36408.1 Putative HpcH/HpaI aldolase [Paraburkholderia xenovorans LB400]AIP34143.1 hpcH/HpaI aldolase/citrate lyase family protein [Paraburkholderia xenovorans LB400]